MGQIQNKDMIVNKLITFLEKRYKDANCSLNHKNPFELLVATILSAQCTDERVNIVTKKLFNAYKTPYDFANADLEKLKEIIKPTGFYNNKAKNIKEMSKILVEKYNAEIPDKIDELVTLPGIGRKTANVVLGIFFEPQGIVVDTHVKRISKRLSLTDSDDPEKIEQDLTKIIPKKIWDRFSHQMIHFGREICKARKPDCEKCEIKDICSFYNNSK
jgi:endonuclease-3